jgi:uncharacterized membrane-anchored protein YjiN (DUF445 family)
MHDQLLSSQQLALTRMKRIATALFIVMTGTFFLASSFTPQFPWLAWVRAFAEAAMIGALADWFAVTALFRHPLGLPIPHTRIIPRNQERIAETMGSFVQSNFLSEGVIVQKLQRFDPAYRAAHWLSIEGNAEKLAARGLGLLPEAMGIVGSTELHEFLRRSLSVLFQEVKPGELAGNALDLLLSNDVNHQLMNEFLRVLELALQRHERYLRETLREEMPWYVPKFVHDRVYANVMTRVRQQLAEITGDAEHPFREKARQQLREWAQKMKASGELAQRAEECKQWLLSNPALSAYSSRLWQQLRDLLTHDLAQDDSRFRRFVAQLLRSIGTEVLSDARAHQRVNSALSDWTRRLLESYREEIVRLVSDTVRMWDSKTINEKLELHVGRDLQYIRINGTIVGGLAGLALYALSRLLGYA